MKIFYWIASIMYTGIALIEAVSNGWEAFYPPLLLAGIFLVLGNIEQLREK